MRSAGSSQASEAEGPAPSGLNAPSMFFQPTNGVGLGHLSRLAAIALAVRSRERRVRLLFGIAGASHALVESWGLPHVSIPVSLEQGAEVWSCWTTAQRLQFGAALADSMLRVADPDLVVFDCEPSRSFARAALSQARLIAICIREVKNFNEYRKRTGRILEAARLIIVPHEPGDWELPAEYMPKARFVGTVTRPIQAKASPGGDVEPLIVITGGGGGHPGTAHFYNMALQAYSYCRRRIAGLQALLVAGPLFQDWRALEMVEGARVEPFDLHLMETISRSALVVAQGGYNTVGEIVALGVPAICVPAERFYDDQFRRSAATARSLPWFKHYAGTSPLELAETMLSLLAQPRSSRPTQPEGPRGALAAADALLELVHEARRSRHGRPREPRFDEGQPGTAVPQHAD